MKTINEIYKSMLLDIFLNGHTISPRGIMVKEIRNYQITLEDLTDNLITVHGVKTNVKYARKELEWYICGCDRIDYDPLIEKIWAKYSDDGVHVNSNYGHRIFGGHVDFIDQYQWVINELGNDPDSRRAVINIVQDSDKILPTKDFPCTMYIQAFVRDGALHWTVCMRSNDVYFGFRNDVFCFTELQKMMARDLGLKYGTYTHFVGSMHMYEAQFTKIERMMADGTINLYEDEELFERVLRRRVFGKEKREESVMEVNERLQKERENNETVD